MSDRHDLPRLGLRAVRRQVNAKSMRFYVNILSTYFPDLDPPYEVYYRQMLEQIELAEELGFECFMFNEHHFLGYGGLIANPAVMLAAAATRTSRIRLGPCIAILSVRHPLQVAEDYAMVDAVSGGRLEFGIGLGNTALDYRVFETPQEEGRARYQEAHDVIVKAWTRERFSHEGRFWNFEEITLYPRPVQQPLPLIWVAGTSPEGLGWAGRQGYHIMTVGHPHPPDKVRAGVEAWRGSRGNGTESRGLPLPVPPAHLRQRERRGGPEDRRAGDRPLRSDLAHPAQGTATAGLRVRLGRNAGDRPQPLRYPGAVHRDHPQRRAPLSLRHPHPQLQLRRPPARGSDEVHAPVRP
ncbi:MAG: LLM class flavin-dependent oxidoreductase [Deltaproteobacteria bacterium]|nr:LLM class flavin-dependent oxidoreductase [Deltaproteobacteria bacterium]